MTHLVVLDGSPQFQSQQEEQLNQEEADDEIAVDRIGVGLLLAADQTETDERNRQENHAGHQTDVSDHIFGQCRFRQRLESRKKKKKKTLRFQRWIDKRNLFQIECSCYMHTINSSLFMTTATGPKLEQVQLTWKSSWS